MIRPTYIDIHAHTNFTAFDADRRETVERALGAGVWIINVGTQRDTSRRAVEMTKEFPEGVYAAIGLHPVHVNPSFHDADELGPGGKAFTSRGEDFDKDYYASLAQDSRVVAIGECGLDFYRAPNDVEKARQIEAFKGQIELALECDLPLILHVRQAYRETLDILKIYKEKVGESLRGDVHFFAGTLADAKEFLDLGFYLSFTGVITFAKQYRELVEFVPIDRIMTETDCPYVAPVPMRGKRNEPLYVTHIADKIAEIKGIDPIECRKQIVENATKFFRL